MTVRLLAALVLVLALACAGCTHRDPLNPFAVPVAENPLP
jgi:hypothetical protein